MAASKVRRPLYFGGSALQKSSWSLASLNDADDSDDELVCLGEGQVQDYKSQKSSAFVGQPCSLPSLAQGRSDEAVSAQKRPLAHSNYKERDQVQKKVKLEGDNTESITAPRVFHNPQRKDFAMRKINTTENGTSPTPKFHQRKLPAETPAASQLKASEQRPMAATKATQEPENAKVRPLIGQRVPSRWASSRAPALPALPAQPKPAHEPTPSKAALSLPFEQDSSDDEKISALPPPSSLLSTRKNSDKVMLQPAESILESARAKAARKNSERLREEALKGRQSTNCQDGRDAEAGPKPMEIAHPATNPLTSSTMMMVNGPNQFVSTSAQITIAPTTLHASEHATASMVEPQKQKCPQLQSPGEPHSGHAPAERSPPTKTDQQESRPRASFVDTALQKTTANRPPEQEATAMSGHTRAISSSNVNPIPVSLNKVLANSVQRDSKVSLLSEAAKSQADIRAENSRKHLEKLQAQIREAEKARRQEQTKQHEEKDAGEEAIAKRSWEAAEVADKQQQAIKEADAKRKQEWERKTQEKRSAEARKLEEHQKLQDAQKAEVLKKREEQKTQQNAIHARSSALSILEAAKQAAQARRRDEDAAQRATPKVSSEEQQSHGEVLKNGCSAAMATQRPHGGSCMVQERAIAPSDHDEARQQRIKAKEEMNRKKQQAEKIEQEMNDSVIETESPKDGPKPISIPPADLQQGSDLYHQLSSPLPRSLQRLGARPGGLVAARKDREAVETATLSQPMIGSTVDEHEHEPSRQRINNQTKGVPAELAKSIGQVLQHDIAVLRWREEGQSWRDVADNLRHRFGITRYRKTVSKRTELLQKALKDIDADDTLLDAVAGNDTAAIKILNERIHGEGRIPQVKVVEGKRNVQGRFIGSDSLATTSPSAIRRQQAISPACSSDESKTLSDRGPPDRTPPSEHPEFGGKTLDYRTWRYFQEAYADVYNSCSEAEDETSDEIEPATCGDYCHFAYHVERRHITKDQVDDGELIDDVPWVICGDEYDNLDEANKASGKLVTLTPPGTESIIVEGEGYTLSHCNEDGKAFKVLQNEARGIVQVRVSQFLRTFHDGVPPTSDMPLLNRRVWVIQQTTRALPSEAEEVDKELFGEEDDDTGWEVQDVNENIYTALGMANECAIKTFVSMTFKSKTLHLTARQHEIQEEERRLGGEVDEGEPFSRSGTGARPGSDGAKQVKVWVEERRIVGPRNV